MNFKIIALIGVVPFLVVVFFVGLVIVSIFQGIFEGIYVKFSKSPKAVKKREIAVKKREIEEKYKDISVPKDYRTESLSFKLRWLGYVAMQDDQPERALQYLEDSHFLEDSADTWLALAAYYAVIGELDRAKKMVDENPYECDNSIANKYLADVMLLRTDHPLKTMRNYHEQARKHGRGNKELHLAAQVQIARRVLASYDDGTQEAREAEKESTFIVPADYYDTLYWAIKCVANEGRRPQYQELLKELQIMEAIWYCEIKEYKRAWECLLLSGCPRHRLYADIVALIKSDGGLHPVAYDWDSDKLEEAWKDAERASQENVRGADRLIPLLYHAYRLACIRERDALFETVKAIEFEEAHGMSREEYQQQQKEAAEEAARARREQHLRDAFESAERETDLRRGGAGHDAEERRLAGDISFTDYADYENRKERYIKEKSE